MDVTPKLGGLDQNSIVSITAFLDYRDILNLVACAKYFGFLADHQAVWKAQISNCINVDLVHFDEDFPNLNPKEQFRSIIRKVAYIRDLLANIVKKFDPSPNTRSILQRNFMEDLKNKEEVDRIIKEGYGQLPLEYYIMYRLANGEEAIKSKPKELALFGGFTYYDSAYQFNFLPLAKTHGGEFLEQYKLLCLTRDFYSGIRLYVDVKNALQQGYGTIIMFYEMKKEYGKVILGIYTFKPSLLRFLEDLQFAPYNSDDGLLDHFNSWDRPLSDVTTRGIRIRTSVVFNPWDRRHGNYLFVYQIRVSANGVEGRWKLTDRHWIIDDNGTPHEVKGPGVIGLYPEVYEGCEEFTYQSCTPMHGFKGTMKGELYFRNLETGEIVAAVVGEMKMKLPDGTAMLNFYPEDGQVQILETSS